MLFCIAFRADDAGGLTDIVRVERYVDGFDDSAELIVRVIAFLNFI